jgi:hypothetical protein
MLLRAIILIATCSSSDIKLKMCSDLKTLISILFFIFLFKIVEAQRNVSCEQTENHHWAVDKVHLQTCFIRHQIINARDFTISSSRDEKVTGIWFDWNKNCFNLPVNVAEKFPNLEGFSAERCSLKSIEKENFKGLKKVKLLWITHNLIEMIQSDTFEEMPELTRIYLRKKKTFEIICDHLN